MGKRVWNKGFNYGKYQLAEYYSSKGRLKDYALFLTLKGQYRNSMYKKFSLNKISKRLGVSYYYLKSALQRLEKDGAIRYEHGHLILLKQKKLAVALGLNYLTNFEVDTRDFKLNDTLSQIRRVLLASSHNRMKWRQKRTLLSDNKIRESLTATSDTWYEPFSKTSIQISYLGLAKLWGCSVGTAFNQMKVWNAREEMKKERCYKVFNDLDTWVVTEAAENGDTSFFTNKEGKVAKVMPNKYFFNV